MIIGIDPGLSGAIAAINNGRLLAVEYMPTIARLHGKGQQVDAGELASLLIALRSGNDICVVWIEAVSSSPQMGVRSAYNFGEGVGLIHGVLATLQFPVRLTRPQVWKKAAGLIGKDKDASRSLARQLWPDWSDSFNLKKSDGMAEAAIIALMAEESKL
jgi:crossover junction endodeoxyribonuclease RuvC